MGEIEGGRRRHPGNVERRAAAKDVDCGPGPDNGSGFAIREGPVATIVLAHGAWSAAWAWKKMRPLIAGTGHSFFTPTYTGLGERSHLASPAIDLDTHVEDVLGVLQFEDLRDVVLLGHSYGGMVATGVADRAREKISQLIYLDAFVPRDGQSLFDLVAPEARQRMEETARAGDGWRVQPLAIPPDTSDADAKWLAERRQSQSIRCFNSPLHLTMGEITAPRSYIYCTRVTPADTFGRFAARAKAEPGWRYHEIDASHSPHVTAPEALSTLLRSIVAE
jgi:pimeloyl-ACP methyl ester carboxylesterase